MSRVAWGLVILLVVIRYDFWNWDDPTLVFGFLPIGLAYHAGFSLAAAGVWALVVAFAWPERVEAWAGRGSEDGQDRS